VKFRVANRVTRLHLASDQACNLAMVVCATPYRARKPRDAFGCPGHRPSGIVADEDGVFQKAVGRNAAPQRAFGDDAPGRLIGAQTGDAELVEMGHKGVLIGKIALGVGRERGEDRIGERMLAHIVERRVIDRVVIMPGAQQAQKIEPAFG
jgi:hypothetical protein